MARSLNGSSDYIDTGVTLNTLGCLSAMTLSLWVLPNSSGVYSPAGDNGNGDTSIDVCGLDLFQVNGIFWCRFCDPSHNFYTLSGGTMSIDVWNHFCCKYDGSSVFLYGNGSLVQSASGPSSLYASPATYKLGRRGDYGPGNEANWPGNLAEANIWNVSLNAGEVAALAAGVKPNRVRPNSLKRYWPLWGLASPEPDLSSFAGNATLTGTAQANHAPVTLFTPRSITTPGLAVSGIAFDAVSNSGYQSPASTYSWSHTCTGSNGFLAVDVEILSVPNTTVTGITYNGVALSLIGAQNVVAGTGRVENWGLVNPATGSNTIAVTLSASVASAGTAVSYTNVNQSIPTESWNGNYGINTGTATNSTVNVTTVNNNDWVHAAVATSATSITSSQTSRNNVTGTLGSGADSDTGPITPAGSQTMTWTGEGITSAWAVGGYGIIPSSDIVFVGDDDSLTYQFRIIW
jgi:Concanavalin A-like lectin/glucanases superfamily